MPDTDTSNGSEGLTVDQAAAAFVKATAPEAVQQDDAEEDDYLAGGTSSDDGETQSDETSEAPLAEDDAENGDDADEAVDGEPESEQGRFVADNAKVRLSDGSVTTITELKRGSLREADYTRKTQEVSALKAEAETQSSALKQRIAQIEQNEALVSNLLESILPKQPPRPDTSLADPNNPKFDLVEYTSQQAVYQNWSEWQAYIGQLSAAQQQRLQAANAETETSRKTKADAEWEQAKAKVPEFKDEAKVKAFVEQSFKHGQAYGFTEAELAQAIAMDHRQLLVLRDAMKWRSLQASKPKVQAKTEGRPTVLKGGKRLNPAERQQRGASAAYALAKETGSVENVTAAYLASKPRK